MRKKYVTICIIYYSLIKQKQQQLNAFFCWMHNNKNANKKKDADKLSAWPGVPDDCANHFKTLNPIKRLALLRLLRKIHSLTINFGWQHVQMPHAKKFEKKTWIHSRANWCNERTSKTVNVQCTSVSKECTSMYVVYFKSNLQFAISAKKAFIYYSGLCLKWPRYARN